MVGMFRTPRSGRQHLSISENTAPRRLEEESGYKQVCSKWSRQAEDQRSDIKLRNLALDVWEDSSLWAHGIHCFHLYVASLRLPSSKGNTFLRATEMLSPGRGVLNVPPNKIKVSFQVVTILFS